MSRMRKPPKMLNKLTAVLAVVLIGCSHTFGQAYKDSIHAQFTRFSNCLMNKDFEASTEYLNPGLFELSSKAYFIEMMKRTFENPVLELEVKEVNILSIGESRLLNNEHYVKLNYSNRMLMGFREADAEPDTTSIKKTLQEKLGYANVTYDATSRRYTILVTKEVIANSKDMRNWTFVVLEEKQKTNLQRFIPKELF